MTVVTAAAGYGKSTVVRRWSRSLSAREVTLADLGAVDGGPALYVAEDLPAGTRLPDDVIARFANWPETRLVLTSRHRIAVPARWRGRGVVGEVGPVHLALPGPETAQILGRHGTSDMAAYTGGWPALVHLASRALASGGDPAAAVTGYLIDEVLAELPVPLRKQLRTAAYLPTVDGFPVTFTAALAALGLVRDGRLLPAVADAVRAWRPLTGAERHAALVEGAARYQENRKYDLAVRCFLDAPDHEGAAGLLRAHGDGLIAAGHAELVATCLRAAESRDAQLRLMLGEALQVTGDSDSASEVYAALAGPADSLPAGLAWRAGVVEYLRGKPQAAGAYFERADLGSDSDSALLLGWSAAAKWMLGDPASAGDLAARAMNLAASLSDDAALATAHIAQALHCGLTGDRVGRHQHYDLALGFAEAAGDVVQVTRIRANQASILHQEGRYAEALLQVRPAVQLAEQSGYAAMLALALCNRAEILLRLGHLAESEQDYARGAQLYRRMGSRKVAYALNGAAELHRLHGRLALARAVFEEAARIAGADADLQGLIPALAGLARSAAADDPAIAAGAARRAVEAACPGGQPGHFAALAYLAAGEVALAAGDQEQAAAAARTAASHARRHADMAALADALELAGHASTEPAEARRAYLEARRTWQDAGASLNADRLSAVLGQLPGADTETRSAGRVAAGRLTALGIATARWPGSGTVDSVAVRTLGHFTVLIGGEPLPAGAWQSRKARDLLRILTARRGRAVPREELAELLWPGGEEPSKVAHRLTVALSVLRAVLDPEKRRGPDWYVRADSSSAALDLSHVDVDLESFLSTAEHGLRLASGNGDALPPLTDADRAYPGDFLADEPYDDWAAPVRDYARSTFIQVERALARLAAEAGDTDGAVRALLRLLEADPYDAAGHQDCIRLLSAAGRHGEAGRAYDRYVAAMSALGLPADGVEPPPAAARR
ncbi:BTAD domain-containing putative transcriptional regulator [Longispora albida]|uniref:BTAD domain-containing putative transcriptional regulator n=1 Tax=Longispora albida TaxID=203523 RepID=UPI0012F9B994|nr:BTAD domain-containing putative transcriptional regulator [Longispora albida]